MSKDCPQCSVWRSKNAKYCGECGKDLSEPDSSAHPILHLMTLLATFLVAFVVIVDLAYCIINFNAICSDFSDKGISISLSYGFGNIKLAVARGTGISVLFALIIASEFICLAYAIWRFIPRFSRDITENTEGTESTGLSAGACCLCASLILSIVYFIVAAMFGYTADASWMDEYTDNQLVLLLTRAGIREEILFRVIWIGIPMMAFALVKWKDARCWQYLFGGFGLTKLAVAVIIISAILFGLAHTDGWGLTKVLDAAMAGVIFGYIYVEYGLYAAVIAHTANDTISTIAIAGFGTGISAFIDLALIGLGLLILVYWIMKPNMDAVDVRKMKTYPGKLESGLKEQWGRH